MTGQIWNQGAVLADEDGELFANLTDASLPIDTPYKKRRADAARVAATWNAFHSPDRSIPTDQITEELFWRMYDLLNIWVAGGDTARGIGLLGASKLLSSLKVEQK